jgi:hypothetical protein
MADFGACGPDGLQGFLAGGGEGVDQAGDGRVGGDRAEDGRLAPQHRDVREAVPAQCDRRGDVQKGFAGVVDCPRFAPRCVSPGKCSFPCSQQDPQQVLSLQGKGTFRVSGQPLDSPPHESPRLGRAA